MSAEAESGTSAIGGISGLATVIYGVRWLMTFGTHPAHRQHVRSQSIAPGARVHAPPKSAQKTIASDSSPKPMQSGRVVGILL